GVRVPTVPSRTATFLMRHAASLPDADLADPHLGELLAVPLLAPVVLPPLPFEDDDLLALPVGHDLARHRRTLYRGCPDLHLAVGTRQEHLVEGHGVAHLGGEGGDPDRLAGLHAKLLVATANDCVHDLIEKFELQSLSMSIGLT